MPRAKSSFHRPPRYIVEPGALIYESLRLAAGLKPVSAEARDTYRVILGFAWMNHYQFTPPITRRQIADERGIADESTVTRHIAELTDAGYMTVQPDSGSASTYIPNITYQKNTATANSPAVIPADIQPTTTAYSPAVIPADTQPTTATANSPAGFPADTQPTTATEPLAYKSGVSAEPLARVQGVPINSSSSLIHLNLTPDPKLLQLHNLLLDFGVFPDSADEILRTEPPEIILAWLHTLVESENVRNVAGALVACILRDHRQPPRVPADGTPLARDRVAREIEWGIRPASPRPAQHEPVEHHAPAVETQTIWRQALEELKLQLTSSTYDAYLRDATLIAFDGSTCTIAVKNEHTRAWIEDRMTAMLQRTLTGIICRPASVTFVVAQIQPNES